MSKRNTQSARVRHDGGAQLTGMHRALMHAADDAAANEAIKTQAENTWTSQNGAELIAAETEAADVNEQMTQSCETRKDLNKRLRCTRRRIPAGASNQEDGSSALEPAKYSTWDLITTWVLGISAVACLLAGASNVFSNLMASGNDVFIENPWLAIALSSLLPIGSLSIKQISSFFDFDRTKKRYTFVIYGLLIIVVIIWSVLFALEFPGISTSIDVGDLLVSSKRGSSLVWAQLATEMLAGSALFLAMERIAIKYKPNYLIENPEYREAVRAVASHAAQHEKLRARAAHLEGEIARLKADRQAFITYHITILTERRSLLHQAHNPQF